jgi:hypothetical protein
VSVTEKRLAANQTNALRSTGPVTFAGKAASSRNATRHGLLSAKLFLDDEDPAEFQNLLGELWRSLNPVGSMEVILVERIAVTVWRQRRLIGAETASLSLARQPKSVADGVSSELGRDHGSHMSPEDLAPDDMDRDEWCRMAISEIESLGEFDIRSLEQRSPMIFGKLKLDAEVSGTDPILFAGDHKGGLTGYVDKLYDWCREQVRNSASRSHVQLLADQVRAKRLVLPNDTLEVFSRYQTTLDNQLFKTLKALRDAQEWRLQTLVPVPQAHAPVNEPDDFVG